MKIENLTRGKRAITISASASLLDLVNTLEHHHVGALVVSGDGERIDGIVSERDVVRAMPQNFLRLKELTVRDVMTHEVVTTRNESTVAEVMNMMTHNRIRHVPVVGADGRLISIVSIGDLVKAHIDEIDGERVALRNYINQ